MQPAFLQSQCTDAAVVVGVGIHRPILLVIGEEDPQGISVVHGDDGVETELFPVLHSGQRLIDPAVFFRVTAAKFFPEPGDFCRRLMRHDDAGQKLRLVPKRPVGIDQQTSGRYCRQDGK